jgi:hypothetical protein
MSGVSLPVTRPKGRALVVASPTSRVALVDLLARLGFESAQCDDPYAAAAELARRRLTYGSLILSLAGLYREELGFISTVKRRFPHIEIWLAHTDGRQAALAEAMRLGADGLVDGEGLHASSYSADVKYPVVPEIPQPVRMPLPENAPPSDAPPPGEPVEGIGEPVLTADELRALLQDQPAMPPSSEQT